MLYIIIFLKLINYLLIQNLCPSKKFYAVINIETVNLNHFNYHNPRETFFNLRRYVILPRNRKVSWSVSSILPNKMGRSALLSHPLALASKLMSSLQHYTVQTLIPSPNHPKAHLLSTPLPVYPLCALLGLLSKPALNHTSAHDAARSDEKGLRRRSKLGKARTSVEVSHLLIINQNLKFCVVYGHGGKYVPRIVAKFNRSSETIIFDVTES